MFESLAEISCALGGIVAGVDPESMSPGDAASVWAQLVRIERLAGAGRTLLAARAELASSWRAPRPRTAAQGMAAVAGEPVAVAEAALATSSNLADLKR